MKGVQRVEQLDARHLHRVADFGGSRHEWDAEITEQVPGERIAWRSIDGQTNTGQVTFPLAEAGKTEVTVEMGGEPEGLKEKVGGALDFDDRSDQGRPRPLRVRARRARRPRDGRLAREEH
jgi:uncharacterized membrane protein